MSCRKEVQRRDALREAALEKFPFLGRDDPRQQIEREDFLRALRRAIDVERDALPQKRRVNRLPLGVKLLRRKLAKNLVKFAIMAAHAAPGVQHFIESPVDLVFFQHINESLFKLTDCLPNFPELTSFPPSKPIKRTIIKPFFANPAKIRQPRARRNKILVKFFTNACPARDGSLIFRV